MISASTSGVESCGHAGAHPKQRRRFPAKVRLVKALVSPVVMYGCERWTIKKAEHHKN